MHQKINVLTALGIGIIAVAVAFLGGIQLQNTAFGAKVRETLAFQENTQQNNELPDDLTYSEVEVVYDELRSSFYGDLTKDELIEGMKRGLVSATGDPYTVYLDAEAVKEFEISLNGEFSGIGAEIAVKAGQLQIVAPIDGTPASKVGLLPGDPIIEIDGESTAGITVEEAVAKIRGEKGTVVTLTIVRNSKPKDVEITRADIDVPNATGEIRDGNIGYIDLSTFGDDAVKEINDIARRFASENVNGVVLDLRNNSGGLLGAAVDVAGLWVDNKVVVEQRGEGRNQGELLSQPGAIFGDIPTVVLINGGSASASEIVAGALQDYGLATIMGEQSFGKGSVQTLEALPEGSKLKVTIARWFTPEGKNISEEGITPDEKVELTTEDFNNDRDPQLDKALELLRN